MILISIQVRELEVAANLCKRGFALILLEETRLVLVEFIELAPKVIKVEGVVLYGICFGLLRALGSTLWSWHMAVSQSKGKTTFERAPGCQRGAGLLLVTPNLKVITSPGAFRSVKTSVHKVINKNRHESSTELLTVHVHEHVRERVKSSRLHYINNRQPITGSLWNVLSRLAVKVRAQRG